MGLSLVTSMRYLGQPHFLYRLIVLQRKVCEQFGRGTGTVSHDVYGNVTYSNFCYKSKLCKIWDYGRCKGDSVADMSCYL